MTGKSRFPSTFITSLTQANQLYAHFSDEYEKGLSELFKVKKIFLIDQLKKNLLTANKFREAYCLYSFQCWNQTEAEQKAELQVCGHKICKK